ncbi:MAG: FAD-dependent thymidylate synthase [Candidatus Pelagibacter sp. TMED239]|nr:MAG: FAD-dependent thymidylate synthase [Candidatus Pelagibacter sp. TMED239]|tara:strand:+ start:855 stop:1496 length:642 start_codon:yes stop_codon:yes gene_type:complete
MKVERLDKMGSDLSVVNAARVSYSKVADEMTDKDEKLIKYLVAHDHWSPFAHASAQFRIQAPIYVARQLVKHQVGLSWNEVSRRYVSDEPEIQKIQEWRGRPKDSKQGSDGLVDLPAEVIKRYEEHIETSIKIYKELIYFDVAPEIARSVLPQSMMTEWIWSGTLYAFARVCNLRCKPDTQKETRFIANSIDMFMREDFPVSWKYLCPEERKA